jgi:hypothetical protein
MDSDSSQNSRQLMPLYLACYVLWLGLSALGVWLIFALRSALIDLAFVLRLNPWQVRAVDNFGFVTLGLIWLVGTLLLEHRLRQAVVKNQLWKRAAYVGLAEVIVLGLCYGLRLVLA